MLLIADSGSSKTDWKLVKDEGTTVATIKTQGLNPYFLTVEEIATIIKEKVAPQVGTVEKVFFYGAGCGLSIKADQVKEAIEATISAKFPAEVSGDIFGAARSLLQDQAGIACILGTGANSCVYDGTRIMQNVPSLGYILADWGSGTVMGKDFLSILLQEKLPEEIMEDFVYTYKLDRRQILDNIYNKPMANRFLASFTPFLLKHADNVLLRDIIMGNFRKFFTYFILGYGKREAKVALTGSVAYHFRHYLVEVGADMGIEIDKIVQHPMDGLVHYHIMRTPVVK